MSNIKQYKYDWIWNKKLAWNWILAKIQPLKIHELVHIFSNGKVIYNPQMTKWRLRSKMWVKTSEINWWEWFAKETFNDDYYPQSIQEFTIANLRRDRLHPTQKPVALIEYLIKTYTNEWETVLDFTIGSGTTAIAALNTNRNYIGFEMDKWYFDIAKERILNHNKL
jgi:site-specific DNA-methyltransferase (adenine-specific)